MMKKNLTLLTVALLAAISAGAQNHIYVSKQALRLCVVSAEGDTLLSLPCCAGANLGDKQRRGDKRTPEGTFSVSRIQDSRYWIHDFHDGAGPRRGAYGPWFFRLTVPGFSGIGIHGTCFPESIGTRDSDGCVRLRNEDLLRLRGYVFVGMKVTIAPDEASA